MNTTVYLVMNVYGVKRMTKNPPALRGDERSVAIEINVDDSIFEYSFMKTTLNIEEDDVIEPSLDIQLLHDADLKL